MNPYEKGYKPKPLNPELYGPAQAMAANGDLPHDHPAWRLTERDEAASMKDLHAVPDSVPPGLRPSAADDKVVKGSCSCGVHWVGALVSHCATCHLTFTSVSGFDDHRVGGKCRDETAMRAKGYEPNDKGQWRVPRPEGTWT